MVPYSWKTTAALASFQAFVQDLLTPTQKQAGLFLTTFRCRLSKLTCVTAIFRPRHKAFQWTPPSAPGLLEAPRRHSHQQGPAELQLG